MSSEYLILSIVVLVCISIIVCFLIDAGIRRYEADRWETDDEKERESWR